MKTDDKNGEMLKKELLKKCEVLHKEYGLQTDFLGKKYIVNRIIDLLGEMENLGFEKGQIVPIKKRLIHIERYTQIYDYSLAEQLREQKTIVADSIQSSPFHLKKIELKNTSMIQFQQRAEN